MKYLTIALILTSCARGKIFSTEDHCCDFVCLTMSEGIKMADSLDRCLFIIVLNEKDSGLHHQSIPELLNFSSQEDKSILKTLNREYLVVKLHQHDFIKFQKSLANYEYMEDYKEVAGNNKSTSYVFISAPTVLSIYSPIQLNQKEKIRDLIHVKMGP